MTRRPCYRCGTQFNAKPASNGSPRSYCNPCSADIGRDSVRNRATTLRQQRHDATDVDLWLIAARVTGGSKHCPQCDTDVPVARGRWYLRRYRHDALSGWCRACSLAYDAEKRAHRSRG